MSGVDVLRDLIRVDEDGAMNPDLRSWRQEHREDVGGVDAAAGDHVGSTDGGAVRQALPASHRSCHVCRKPGAAVCLRCDKAACKRHHHVMYGLCSGCMRAQGTDSEDDAESVKGSTARPDLDIDWVDD